ncbi:uncharacterized protein LOC143222916 isoform X2 [Tachypleus tridentatus]|uniref:uncharacterized protein LOC143222916 isoform X2 n=1 Tax=Tachypleus tridentatus TaxID=6853 RepID=UPI003FCF2455
MRLGMARWIKAFDSQSEGRRFESPSHQTCSPFQTCTRVHKQSEANLQLTQPNHISFRCVSDKTNYSVLKSYFTNKLVKPTYTYIHQGEDIEDIVVQCIPPNYKQKHLISNVVSHKWTSRTGTIGPVGNKIRMDKYTGNLIIKDFQAFDMGDYNCNVIYWNEDIRPRTKQEIVVNHYLKG